MKIGSAADAGKRLASLQCGNHEPLRLLRVIDGYHREECQMHGHFADCHIRGEWYIFRPDMLTVQSPAAASQTRGQMLVARVIRDFGGLSALSRLFGFHHPSVVQGWRDRGVVPTNRMGMLLKLSNERGVALTADELIEAAA